MSSRWKISNAIIQHTSSATSAMPKRIIKEIFSESTHKKNLAICLHRICRKQNEQDHISTDNDYTIELIDEIYEARKSSEATTFITFDDGYLSSCDFIKKNAQRYSAFNIIYFLCPIRSAEGIAFPWDQDTNTEPEQARLSTIKDCTELSKITNVSLGNHTNNHHNLASLTKDDLIDEISKSRSYFSDNFSTNSHFAYPFGWPNLHINKTTESVCKKFSWKRWSTSPGTFNDLQWAKNELLPRFAISNTKSPKEHLLYISAKSTQGIISSKIPWLHRSEAS